MGYLPSATKQLSVSSHPPLPPTPHTFTLPSDPPLTTRHRLSPPSIHPPSTPTHPLSSSPSPCRAPSTCFTSTIPVSVVTSHRSTCPPSEIVTSPCFPLPPSPCTTGSTPTPSRPVGSTATCPGTRFAPLKKVTLMLSMLQMRIVQSSDTVARNLPPIKMPIPVTHDLCPAILFTYLFPSTSHTSTSFPAPSPSPATPEYTRDPCPHTDVTPCLCPAPARAFSNALNLLTSSTTPPPTFHTITVPSTPPVTILSPNTHILVTCLPPCPLASDNIFPVSTSHARTFPSPPPLNTLPLCQQTPAVPLPLPSIRCLSARCATARVEDCFDLSAALLEGSWVDGEAAVCSLPCGKGC